jgi:hypothetical protein
VARVSALVSNVSVVPAVAGLPYFVGVPAVAFPAVAVFHSAIVSSLGFLLAGVSA